LFVREPTLIGATVDTYMVGVAVGAPEPSANANYARLFVDQYGNLKIKFPDGTVLKVVLTP
jgi:hypothetical protein